MPFKGYHTNQEKCDPVFFGSHSDFSVTTKEGNNYMIPKGHIVATSPAFANRLPYID